MHQEHEDTYCRRFPLVCDSCGHEEIPREEVTLPSVEIYDKIAVQIF